MAARQKKQQPAIEDPAVSEINENFADDAISADNEAARKKILNRLKTIRGHIAGVEKMIEDGKCCDDILLQIGAIKSSIHKVGLVIMEEHAMECLIASEKDEHLDTERMESIIKTIIHYSK